MRLTSALVASAWGPDFGVRFTRAVSPLALVMTGLTVVGMTSGSAWSFWRRPTRTLADWRLGSSAATSRRPVYPGPKPALRRSYAWVLILDLGWVLSSGKPSFREKAGMARATITTAPIPPRSHGRR